MPAFIQNYAIEFWFENWNIYMNGKFVTSRRGVGAIIGGAILAAILFTAVYIYFFVILEGQTTRGKEDARIQQLNNEKKLEVFSVQTVKNLTSNKINVLVNNTGSVPMELKYMYFYNSTFAPVIPPSGKLVATINGGQTKVVYTTLNSDLTKKYTIHVVSGRGNVGAASWPPKDTLTQTQTIQVTNITQNIFEDQVSSVISGGIAISPDMYLVIPGPFGDSAQQGLWGAVVVNPTNSSMSVSRVAITMYTAQHTSATQIMARSCVNTPISPVTASEWTCPHDNQVQWKDLATPEIIAAGQVKSFLVRVQPGGLFTGQEEPASAVVATVFTDIGVFAKAGYSVGMTFTSQPLGNVYLTDTTNAANALLNNHMFGHRNNVVGGSTQLFQVTFSDLDTNSTSFIRSGSKLIINIPGDFKNVTVTSAALFNTPTIQKRADGFTQIIATTVGNTGDAAAGEAKVLEFRVVAPKPAKSTIYIFSVFNDGQTNTAVPFSAGALAEIPVQVNGTP